MQLRKQATLDLSTNLRGFAIARRTEWLQLDALSPLKQVFDENRTIKGLDFFIKNSISW